MVNGRPVAIELLSRRGAEDRLVRATLKGQTATARNKTAHTDTGLVLHVPEYVTEGEYVRVEYPHGRVPRPRRQVELRKIAA